MNVIRGAFSVPGYLYNYVAGSEHPSTEPLLEQARVMTLHIVAMLHCCSRSCSVISHTY